jgi:hypothetical protein
MKVKRLVVLLVLVLALMVVALILPAAATADSGNPDAWCTWGVSSANRGFLPQVSTWSVHVKQLSETEAVGREVMNWAYQRLPYPFGFPIGHYETTDIVYFDFTEPEPGTYQAIVVFRWTEEPFKSLSPSGVAYHTFLLIDRPGDELDHVGAWSNPYVYPGVGMGLEMFDVDCRGVQVVIR